MRKTLIAAAVVAVLVVGCIERLPMPKPPQSEQLPTHTPYPTHTP